MSATSRGLAAVATIAGATAWMACGSNETTGGTTSASASSSGEVGGASASSSSGVASSTSTASSSGASAGGAGGGFQTAAHPAWPVLAKTGPGEMPAPRVVHVVPANESQSLSDAIWAEMQAIPASAWYAAWSTDYPELGAARASVQIQGGAIPQGTIVDTDYMTSYLDDATQASGAPPDGATIYLVVLPKGVSAKNQVGAPGVHGRHARYGMNGDELGIVQQAPGGSPVAPLQVVASHEVAEAMTDVGLGYRVAVMPGANPWTADAWASWEGAGAQGGFVENGDLCEGTRIVEGNATYQRIYTNRAAKKGGDPCEPALRIPYFNVGATQSWFQGAPGQELDIPITGWSTAPTTDFWVTSSPAAQSDPNDTYAVVVDAKRTGALAGKVTPLLNNGEQASLKVTIPATAASGSWAVLSIRSAHTDPSGNPIDGEDRSHLWALGIYVP